MRGVWLNDIINVNVPAEYSYKLQVSIASAAIMRIAGASHVASLLTNLHGQRMQLT